MSEAYNALDPSGGGGRYDADDPIFKARKYRNILYGINLLTMVFAIAVLGLSARALTGHAIVTDVVVPGWAFKLALAFGVVVAGLSALGLYGAYSNKKHMDEGTTNTALMAYFLVVLLGVVLQAVAGAALLTQLKVVKNDRAAQVTDEAAVALNAQVIQWIGSHNTTWQSIETSLNCCGWNTTGDATAANCPVKATVTCRDLVLTEATDQAEKVGAVAFALVLMQILALGSSCVMLFCLKRS